MRRMRPNSADSSGGLGLPQPEFRPENPFECAVLAASLLISRTRERFRRPFLQRLGFLYIRATVFTRIPLGCEFLG